MEEVNGVGVSRIVKVQMRLSTKDKKTIVIINPKSEYQGTDGKSFSQILKEKMIIDSFK